MDVGCGESWIINPLFASPWIDLVSRPSLSTASETNSLAVIWLSAIYGTERFVVVVFKVPGIRFCFSSFLVSKLSRSARKATDMIRHSRATLTTASLLVLLLNSHHHSQFWIKSTKDFFFGRCVYLLFIFFPPQNIHILSIQWGTLWVAGGLWSSRLPSTGCRVKTRQSSHCWPKLSGCREPFTPSSEWSQVMLSLCKNK